MLVLYCASSISMEYSIAWSYSVLIHEFVCVPFFSVSQDVSNLLLVRKRLTVKMQNGSLWLPCGVHRPSLKEKQGQLFLQTLKVCNEALPFFFLVTTGFTLGGTLDRFCGTFAHGSYRLHIYRDLPSP